MTMETVHRALVATQGPRLSRPWWRSGLLAAMAITAATLIAPDGASVMAQTRGPTSVADIAERLQNAVVNISTTQKLKDSREVPLPEVPKGSPFEEFFEDFFDKQDRGRGGGQRANSLGSGFVIDKSGYIVTNNHVIEGADEIIVNFTDGSKLKVVQVVGRDAKTDLALLRVEPKKPLVAVNFGDSQKMRVGDWVMAIGNPFGLGGTVTVGVISATRRDINSGLYDEFLQTDAAINRGNSGGPLFSMDGEVIGINTAIISPTGGSIGIGFAVPSNSASQVIAQLKEFGETRRGWLGVRIQTVTDEIAESLSIPETGGALVANVTADGPAAAAGLQVGDIVLKFDGLDVTAMRQLPKLVAQTPIDKEVEVIVLRKGERKTFKVKIGRLEESSEAGGDNKSPKPAEKPRKQSMLGLSLASMSDELRNRYDIDQSVSGVVVTGVEPESVADEKEVHVGDVIVEVTHSQVKSPDELTARLGELRKLNRKTALLLVSTAQGEMNFVPVPLEGDNAAIQ
jgi:serine protease Do